MLGLQLHLKADLLLEEAYRCLGVGRNQGHVHVEKVAWVNALGTAHDDEGYLSDVTLRQLGQLCQICFLRWYLCAVLLQGFVGELLDGEGSEDVGLGGTGHKFPVGLREGLCFKDAEKAHLVAPLARPFHDCQQSVPFREGAAVVEDGQIKELLVDAPTYFLGVGEGGRSEGAKGEDVGLGGEVWLHARSCRL